MNEEFAFILPVGYVTEDGKPHRSGKMRLATALDEIKIHADERMLASERYHDILLFSRVINTIEDVGPVDTELVEGLFEVDFRYLQSLYMERNGQLQYQIESECPKCESRNSVNLADVYSNLEFYFSGKEMSPQERDVRIRTDFNFVLPRGLDDEPEDRTVGSMRLARVRDILQIYHDVRVKELPSYFYVVLLSRVVNKLGKHRMVSPSVIENLHPENFAFLVDFFNEINHKVISMLPIECSDCGNQYVGEVSLVGEL